MWSHTKTMHNAYVLVHAELPLESARMCILRPQFCYVPIIQTFLHLSSNDFLLGTDYGLVYRQCTLYNYIICAMLTSSHISIYTFLTFTLDLPLLCFLSSTSLLLSFPYFFFSYCQLVCRTCMFIEVSL